MPKPSPLPRRIAVIGAGMTGLTAARRLTDLGFAVTVFEKSRGLGGRLASRRTDDGISFDHGTQYVTARGSGFRSVLGDVARARAAGLWRPILADNAGPSPTDWMVGTATMNKLIAPIAQGITVRRQTAVTGIARCGSGWRLAIGSESDASVFDAVASTVPAPQLRSLLRGERSVHAAIAGVRMALCWALMMTFRSPYDPGFDLWRSDRRDLAWVCRNASKPVRDGSRDCWVLHASPGWSERHLEMAPDAAASMMIDLLTGSLPGPVPEIDRAVAHCWRYAHTTRSLGRPCVASPDGTLVAGGDWALGARVECAYDSGMVISDALSEILAV